MITLILGLDPYIDVFFGWSASSFELNPAGKWGTFWGCGEVDVIRDTSRMLDSGLFIPNVSFD